MSRLARPADRICTGSGLVLSRLGARAAAWIRRARRDDLTGWQAALGCWLRTAALGLGLYLLWRLVRAMPNLLWLLSTGWLLAAWQAGKTRADEAAAEPEPEAEDQPQRPHAESLVPSLPDLRASLLRVGTPHAHVAVLAADIGTTPERVREALDTWRIPVEPVRMRGRGSSTGVKGGPSADPALAPRADDAAVVAAGQPGNNDNNTTFTTVPDKENPVRTHVVWRDH